MIITTRNGDDGYTSLLNGKRVHKFDLRIELLGTMDELTSHIGLIKYEISEEDIKEELQQIQKNLSIIMTQIAYGNSDKYNLPESEVENIESLTNKYESMSLIEDGFVRLGKSRISALIDIGRAAARRLERQLLSVDRFYPVHNNCKIYLNRISDYLFAAARYVDFKEEIRKKVIEVLGEQGMTGANILEPDKLNLNIAKSLLEAVEKKAESINLAVVIAVANEWGNTIAVHFMDNALPASYNIAVDKAYSAAAVRLTTEEIGKLAQNGQSLYGIGNTNNNRIITFGGGCPLKIGGIVVGGIGVSGGSAEQDMELAEYGAGMLKALILQ